VGKTALWQEFQMFHHTKSGHCPPSTE